jgi:hypothetical protein
MKRPQKVTFGEMREPGVRGVLIYCSDYKCSHSTAVSADQWPDDVRLSDLEDRFVCKACGKRGADIRPVFHWDTPGLLTRGTKRPKERAVKLKSLPGCLMNRSWPRPYV